MQPVDPATLPGLDAVIGPDRLAPYLTACARDHAAAVRLYCWNVEASAALLGAFAVLEVGIRNTMHDQLSAHWGRADWWTKAPLGSKETDEIADVTGFLDRKRGSGNWSAGHVVAELRVSFWEGLLVNRYHAALWLPALRFAFPQYSGRRGALRERLERLRLLRNRAAHHEPIHARDLMIDHQYMCDLAGFVASDLRTWIASHSRLPSVVNTRALTVAGGRPTRF